MEKPQSVKNLRLFYFSVTQYLAAQAHITTQTTYHNALKSYVQSLTDVEKISAVTYGMTLPKKYRTEMEAKLAIAQEQMNAIVTRLSQAVTGNAE